MTNPATPPRVFIGSGEASLLERKTLIHSLRKHSRQAIDIYVFNGTHNSVQKNDEPPFLAPMSLSVKMLNGTEFSLYRFLIPQLCGHQGKAVWLDSDIICLTDIAELFNTPMNGHAFLAKKEAYQRSADYWGLSVMLIDCERSRFDLDLIAREIEQGHYTYADFMNMSAQYLARHPTSIGALDPNWNVFDRCDSDTKIIHYTDLFTQPWKYRNHPYGDLWFEYFRETMAAGLITQKDIDKVMFQSYVRRDIMKGNYSLFGRPITAAKKIARYAKRMLVGSPNA